MKYVILVFIFFHLMPTIAQTDEKYINFYSFLCDSLVRIDAEFEAQGSRIFVLDEDTLLKRVDLYDDIDCSMFYCTREMEAFIEGAWSRFKVLNFETRSNMFVISLLYIFSEGRDNPNERGVIHSIEYYYDK